MTTPITYESFGAVGDGIADDLPAIRRAHEHANAHRLPVRSHPNATYHLGRRALTATIATDTDWNTSRFTVDDTNVEDPKTPLFEVRSLLDPVDLNIPSLQSGQTRLDLHPPRDCYMQVFNDQHLRFIRRGLNQGKGTPQRDAFILRTDGSVEGPIEWDYQTVTRIEAHALDQPLTITGGVFTTLANRDRADAGYDAYARNIVIHRSNTTVVGLVHYVTGETDVGKPYNGFLAARSCANVTFRDCFATGHKIYWTIGSAGKDVAMGSYDYTANGVVNFRMVNCTQNLILDRTRWGVVASNFCKNIVLEDCTLSRMDTHMGVAGGYTIRRCRLGHMGLNAIGRGPLTIEDSRLFGPCLVSFRGDYGSTWQGDVTITNTRWTPACGEPRQPHVFGVSNDGMHDFGYPCSMPHHIHIDGLHIHDANHPDDYHGPYLLSDPDNVNDGLGPIQPTNPRPHPYQPTQSITHKNVTTATGKPLRTTPNADLAQHVEVTHQ